VKAGRPLQSFERPGRGGRSGGHPWSAGRRRPAALDEVLRPIEALGISIGVTGRPLGDGERRFAGR